MKNVVIINASGFGREVYELIKTLPQYGKEFVVRGFLDDRQDILKPYQYEHAVLDSAENYEPKADDVFVCAISNPIDKKKYIQLIKQKGGVFIKIISAYARILNTATLGEGVIITSQCLISSHVKVGNFVTMNANNLIGHDAILGDYAHLNSLCSVNGHVTVGEFATIQSHAVILPKMQIGKRAVVGAGSIVMRDVPDDTTVFGVPALPVKV